VMVFGSPAKGKSSSAKTQAYWLCGAFGYRLLAIDVKGEYLDMAALLGVPVLSLHPGGQARVNPLDSDGSDKGNQARNAFVLALASTMTGRSLTSLEALLLDKTVDLVTQRNPSAVLSDVLEVLMNPPDELCSRLRKDPQSLLDGTADARYGLMRLVEGSAAGMFDGPSTVAVDPQRGLVVDVSPCKTDDQLLRLSMLAGMRAIEQILARVTHRTLALNDETWRLGTTVETAEWLRHRFKLGRVDALSNWAMVHRASDLSSGDEGSRLDKVGKSMVGDCDTKILFAAGKVEDARAQVELLGLPESVVDMLMKFPQGRALVCCGEQYRSVVQFTRSATLTRLTDTNQAISRTDMDL
ncbi:MAG: hypothetical protein ABMA25_02480, partial [Ilumatobacteraceae bacterium]